jgi:hypothetical protein
MPELFRLFGIKFFFFSNEHLPVHVHIEMVMEMQSFELNLLNLHQTMV